MSAERELLKKVIQDADDGVMSLYLYKEVMDYLSQPEQPPMTHREMYQRGYAAAERDLKREPLSAAKRHYPEVQLGMID